MPIYEFASEEIRPLNKTTFSLLQLRERRDLQRLLRANVSVVAPDTLVIAEEFGDWDESRRRIDLLGIDRDANLVGLIFDGNIQSLTADYMYSDEQSRAVSVNAVAIREALRSVYDAGPLAEELGK